MADHYLYHVLRALNARARKDMHVAQFCHIPIDKAKAQEVSGVSPTACSETWRRDGLPKESSIV